MLLLLINTETSRTRFRDILYCLGRDSNSPILMFSFKHLVKHLDKILYIVFNLRFYLWTDKIHKESTCITFRELIYFLFIYTYIWCRHIFAMVFSFRKQSQSFGVEKRVLCIKSPRFEGPCFYNPCIFFPVKNCFLNGEPFTKTMKLGVPALTKNLLTEKKGQWSNLREWSKLI